MLKKLYAAKLNAKPNATHVHHIHQPKAQAATKSLMTATRSCGPQFIYQSQ